MSKMAMVRSAEEESCERKAWGTEDGTESDPIHEPFTLLDINY